MWEPFDSSKLYTSLKDYLAYVQSWNLSVIRHCGSGKQSGSSLISHSLVGSLLGTIWLLVFPQIPWLLVSNVPNSNAFHSYLSHCKAGKKTSKSQIVLVLDRQMTCLVPSPCCPVIYQILKTVFGHISKHREEG